MTRKPFLTTVVAALAVVAATGAVATAGSGDSGNQLTGMWTATINRPAPLPPLASLQIFMPNGGAIEMANEAQAMRTPQFGQWEHIGGRLYAASGIVFRFDPQTNAHVATIKINRTIRLSEDGQSYTQAARATTYDLNGNVISSFPVTATGHRLEVERIPDEL
jgi:hypothetical protein